jgi:hypothetical protein
MSWEVRALGEQLLAQYAERGPVFVLTPDGSLAEQFRPSDALEPMIPLDEAIESVLDLIKDVPLAKAARVAIAEKLEADPEHVGTSPTRRPRSA